MTTDDFESDLSSILDRIPIGVYRSSIEGKLIFGNRSLADLFGFDSVDEMRRFPLVRLYQSKRDRGAMISELIRAGTVENWTIAFQQRNGTPFWGAVTASALLGTDGNMEYIDGTVRDATGEVQKKKALPPMTRIIRPRREFSFTLDAAGLIQDIDGEGASFFDYDRGEMIGKPLSFYVAPKYRKLFDGFRADVLKKGAVEGILIFHDKRGRIHHVEVHAQAVTSEGGVKQIGALGRDITKTVESQKERLNRERFQGVLEMAGGVVHRLNQPLTVVTNLINEIAAETRPEEQNFEKLRRLQEQVKKLNEIAKKIGNVRKYKAMDYVAGVRIVDIDQAS
jgi:PAS domain S-box-containing protein